LLRRIVGASSTSFVLPQTAKLTHFAASPLPKKSYDFSGTPTSTLDFMAGQEYLPIACYRRTRGNPVFIAGSFSLAIQPKRRNNPQPLSGFWDLDMSLRVPI